MDLDELLSYINFGEQQNNNNSLEGVDEKDYQDGYFELAETFDKNIIKNKIIFSLDEEIDYSSIPYDIYNIYKAHNALNLFFSQNIKICGFFIEPEMIDLEICFVKRILYLYCREEFNSSESFYRMINSDLRTKDLNKIENLISLLGLLYNCIEKKELASYQGN